MGVLAYSLIDDLFWVAFILPMLFLSVDLLPWQRIQETLGVFMKLI